VKLPSNNDNTNDDSGDAGGEEQVENDDVDYEFGGAIDVESRVAGGNSDTDDGDHDDDGDDVELDTDALESAMTDGETVENADGDVVARARGLESLADHGDGGKFECVVCGATSDSEHGAKIHYGREHPDGGDGSEPDWNDVELDTDTGGDGDDGEDEEDDWADVRDAYDAASVAASPINKPDARDALVDLLQDMTEWMSIRERSDAGSSYDLHVWTDEHGWQDNGAAVVAELTARHVGSRVSDTEVNHIVSQLARLNPVDQCETNARHLDRTLIPVANGVIDVDDIDYDQETMTIDVDSVELLDKDPEHRFLFQIDTLWNPEGADVEGLDEWLETITKSDEARRIIWEFAGHSVHPRYPVDGFSVFLGKGGSGKSQTLEVIKAMLGSDNVATQKLQKIQENRFVGAHVVDKRANINTELSGTKISSLDKLKVYSAGEEDSVEKKGEPFYEENNDATMLFASDDPPALPQDNDAIGRRLYPVEFPCQYVDDPDPSNPYELQHRSKNEVQAELQAEERLQGALVRAVEGLKRLLEEDNFTSSKSNDERIEQYESFADPVRDAARLCLEADEDSAIESGDLELTFGSFFADRDHDGKSMSKIKGVLDDMPSLPIAKTRTRTFTEDSSKHIVYRGIKFTEEAKNAWVPDDAHWEAYGGRPGADDEDGDGHNRRPVTVLEANDGQIEETLRVTVVEQHEETAYGWDDQGVLRGETGDSIRYKVENGPALKEGATYDMTDVIVTEHESAAIAHIVPGLTDYVIVDDGSRDDDQHSLDNDDDDGDGNDDNGGDGGDNNSSDSEEIDRAVMQAADHGDTAATVAGKVTGTVDADLSKIEHRVEKLAERGDILLASDTDTDGIDEELVDAVEYELDRLAGNGPVVPEKAVHGITHHLKKYIDVDEDTIHDAISELKATGRLEQYRPGDESCDFWVVAGDPDSHRFGTGMYGAGNVGPGELAPADDVPDDARRVLVHATVRFNGIDTGTGYRCRGSIGPAAEYRVPRPWVAGKCAARLDVTKPVAGAWLDRLVVDGVLALDEKGYVFRPGSAQSETRIAVPADPVPVTEFDIDDAGERGGL
jgi:hypothetical protein